MKKYRVKVTEKHSDYVWIIAENRKEAEMKAPGESQCEYESLYDVEVVQESELDKPGA